MAAHTPRSSDEFHDGLSSIRAANKRRRRLLTNGLNEPTGAGLEPAAWQPPRSKEAVRGLASSIQQANSPKRYSRLRRRLPRPARSESVRSNCRVPLILLLLMQSLFAIVLTNAHSYEHPLHAAMKFTAACLLSGSVGLIVMEFLQPHLRRHG